MEVPSFKRGIALSETESQISKAALRRSEQVSEEALFGGFAFGEDGQLVESRKLPSPSHGSHGSHGSW